MAVISYREALNQAMREEMARDPRVFVMGEEVGQYDGAYKVTQGLLGEFGPWRVVDTPIAELGFAGVGVGAAMNGLRPVIEMMTWNFALLAIDQIVNSAAKLRQMSGGQLSVPVVFRGPQGAAHQLAAQHSQVFEAFYAQVPGLKVAVPATPRDAKGLLKTAIRDDDPVVFMESEVLYGSKGEVPEGELLVPFGRAEIARPGKDVTIVAWQKMRFVALAAAAELQKEGIEAEVIDPRTLRPFDLETVLASVARTNRCVIVEEGWPWMGSGAQIADSIQRHAFDDLDAPVARVTGRDVPMPYARALESAVLPSAERVKTAVRDVLYRG
ncbi:MAG TPA: pyruvate dehydrogenase complex E1 component subunit beta [Anaeromyxobacteraceae bacterium]|nr:pyruvate dehydrogenase complex E1 component subunit beta [Anaeromyxobacteraceae bacterium]